MNYLRIKTDMINVLRTSCINSHRLYNFECAKNPSSMLAVCESVYIIHNNCCKELQNVYHFKKLYIETRKNIAQASAT